MHESLMDIKQTAAYLKMNKMTVYKLARTARIPAFKIASEWRFKKELIDQWLMSRMSGQTEVPGGTAQPAASARPAILVVDDEAIIRDYFKRALFEYTVSVASSGEEAMEMIRLRRPEIVLLDIRMPGMGGIQTLKRIKEFDPSIAVIILSAFIDFETSMEAARLGAYTSVSKPFDLAEMKGVLENASRTKTG
ncbi:MAG: response regulator [Candidatus Omnitrophica bacterium]|nr:response regulator [Candidatus Omnitrophota bacterium]MDD5775724.1 response regulator [Candidatus Omnitrophota bacterium]